MKWLMSWKNSILELFYPDTCILCTEYLGASTWVCESCWQKQSKVTARISEGIVERTYIDDIFSGYYYDESMQKIIHLLKYDRGLSVAKKLGQRLGEVIFDHKLQADFITAVPLNSIRYRERGYNQAELIAQEASRITGIYCQNLLTRKRPIVSQTKMKSAAERVENVKEAFFVDGSSRLIGKKVILVDDLITTGATANESAKVLKSAGAQSVIVLTAARPLWNS